MSVKNWPGLLKTVLVEIDNQIHVGYCIKSSLSSLIEALVVKCVTFDVSTA